MLNAGVSVTFAATTGHAIGDKWVSSDSSTAATWRTASNAVSAGLYNDGGFLLQTANPWFGAGGAVGEARLGYDATSRNVYLGANLWSVNGTPQILDSGSYSNKGVGLFVNPASRVGLVYNNGGSTTENISFGTSTPSMCIGCAGSINSTLALDVRGAGGFTTVSLNGSSSGVVTIVPQPVTSTFNLNLPSSAGLAGQALLSGGGGTSAMTWGTVGPSAGGTGVANPAAHSFLIGEGPSNAATVVCGANTVPLGQGA